MESGKNFKTGRVCGMLHDEVRQEQQETEDDALRLKPNYGTVTKTHRNLIKSRLSSILRVQQESTLSFRENANFSRSLKATAC